MLLKNSLFTKVYINFYDPVKSNLGFLMQSFVNSNLTSALNKQYLYVDECHSVRILV